MPLASPALEQSQHITSCLQRRVYARLVHVPVRHGSAGDSARVRVRARARVRAREMEGRGIAFSACLHLYAHVSA